jgi:hypothetical protein
VVGAIFRENEKARRIAREIVAELRKPWVCETDHLLPPLRPVEAVRMNEQDLSASGSETLAEQPIFLNQTLLFLVSRMDAKHIAGYSGGLFPFCNPASETLENLVAQLDEQHYLDGPTFGITMRDSGSISDAPSRPPSRGFGVRGSQALAAQVQKLFAPPEAGGN